MQTMLEPPRSSASLHLIDLGPAPADLGPIPNARSADFIATWTKDSRLWYTSDQAPTAPDGRIWSFTPATTRPSPH